MKNKVLFYFFFLLFAFNGVNAQTYCTANGNNNSEEWIAGVQIGDFSDTSGADTGGYYYSDNANIQLTAGQSYNFTLTPGYAGTQYTEYWRVWLDINDDGDFSDTGELVIDDQVGGGTGVFSGTFTVPANANNVNSRMRVAMKYVDTSDNAAPNACGTFGYGEVEDFSVVITSGNTGGSTDDPSPYCASSGNAADEWIQSVNIGSYTYNSGSDNGYGNHTDQGTITLQQGSSNTISLVTGYAGSAYDEYWRVWIDFNKDNDFTDAGELVFDAGTANQGTLSSTLNIAASAVTGTTRLRVAMKGLSSTDNAAPNACGTYNFGETEDYLVNIQSSGGSGSTDDPSPYCAASGNSDGEWIESVQFNNINFPTGNGGGYENNTSTVIPLNVSNDISFVLTPGFSGESYAERWRIWIDFNDDNDFTDAGELVFDAPTAVSTTATGTLNMVSATTGNHRMRIAMKYNGVFSDGSTDNTPPEACGTFDFGEVEDYTVSISGTTTQAPVANFTSNVQSGIAPLTVSFTDLSSSSPIAWTWLFTGGNPTSSTSQNPTIVYNTPGVYNVTLTASNSAGSDAETKSGYIVVTENTPVPIANFTSNVQSGTAPLTVSFTDLSSNSPTAWTWNFQGGSPASSTSQNPTIVYNTPGIYDVTLTASNSAGSDVETKTGYITVINSVQTPVANFTSDVTSGAAPLGVNFYDLSSNNPSSWTWSFQGGTPSTSTSSNPTVVYTTAGSYQVSLTVSNSGGTDTETKTAYITVVEPTNIPVANFTSNITSGAAPLGVNFFDQSQNNPTAWTWTFDGATPSTSNSENPFVTYNNAGTYQVSLTVSNAAGTDTETKTGYITVTNAAQAPIANFSSNVQSGVAPLTVNFFDQSANNPNAWAWSFEGGNQLNTDALNPVVVYNEPGIYDVTLTVSNSYGSDSETKTAYIVVSEPAQAPVANFIVSNYEGEAPFVVTFFDQSSNDANSWSWEFAGATPSVSSEKNPTVVYNNPGVYSVSLTVANNVGSNSITKTGIIIVDEVSSVAEINGETVVLNLFPNPSSNNFTLELNGFQSNNLMLNIFSLDGKLVYEQQLDNAPKQQVNIDISNMVSGIYTVIVQDGKNVISEKLIKQ